MKTVIGLKKKTCFLSGESIVIDGLPIPIEYLKEEDYDTGLRLYALIAAIPFTLVILYTSLNGGFFNDILNECKQLISGNPNIWNIVGTVVFGLFLIVLMPTMWWFLIDSLRYRGVWRFNFKRYLYIEKSDDLSLEGKLDAVARSVAQKATKVQCPNCHKIIPSSLHRDYQCPQCNAQFNLTGDSSLEIIMEKRSLWKSIGIITMISSLVLLFLSIFFDKFLFSKFGFHFYWLGLTSMVIGLGFVIVDGVRTGVFSGKTGGKIYREDTPKLFYFYLTTMIFLEAMLIFIVTMPENPNHDAEVYFNRGMKYTEQGDYGKALLSFNEAIEQNSNDVKYYRSRSTIYAKQGDYQRAINDLNKIIELTPQDDTAYNYRGVLYTTTKNFQKALKDLDKALELNPRNAYSYNDRGFIYLNSHQYNKAIEDYNRAIALNPAIAETYKNRGLALLLIGKFNKAEKDIKKSLDLNPNDKQTLMSMTALYSARGNNEEACKWLNKAIEKGYTDRDKIDSLRVLDNIRNSSCYRKIIQTIK
jgi:tetratricopeptide (TPR) repeat protein